MKEYKVYENQTWFDIANHLYGDTSKAIDLASLNNQNVTEDLKAGQIITYSLLEENKYVLLSMQSNNSIPATAIDELTINVPVDYGIGEMAIESTFIVR
jgi:vancomycin resistance protein YoaR